jgi:hypothetical protein
MAGGINLSMDMNARGDAVAVWTAYAPVIVGGPPPAGVPAQAVRVAVRSAGSGGWMPAADLFRSANPSEFPLALAAAVAPDGTLHALFAVRHRLDARVGDQPLYATRRPPGGDWSAARLLSRVQGGVAVEQAWLATDGRGHVTALWRSERVQLPGGGMPVTPPAWFESATTVGADWSNPIALTQPSPDDDQTAALLAVAPSGRALALMGNDGPAALAVRPRAAGPWRSTVGLPWGRGVGSNEQSAAFMPDERVLVLGLTDRPFAIGPLTLTALEQAGVARHPHHP